MLKKMKGGCKMTLDIRKEDIRKKMENKIKEYMDNAQAEAYMINLLDPALSTWEGKQVTKRLITRLRLYIPEDFTLYIRNTYYGIELYIGRGNKNMSVRLCENRKDKTLRMEYVRKENARLYGLLDLYKTYADGKEHLDEWLEEYMKIRKDVVDLKAKMHKYGCEYLIDWSDLRYTI